MSSPTPASTDPVAAYAAATRDVVAAGRWLSARAAGDADTVERAVARVEDAIASQDRRTASAELSAFRATGDRDADATPAEAIPVALLATALTEVQTADTLLALGDLVGEGRPPAAAPTGSGARAEESLRTLERVVDEIPSQPDAPVDAFRAAAAPAMPVGDFQRQADAALSGFVEEADAAVADTLEQLKRLDPTTVLAAIKALGQLAPPELPKLGRLIALAFEKLKRALGLLARLLPAEHVAALRDRLAASWARLSGPDPVKGTLRWAFGTERVEAAIGAMAPGPSVSPEVTGKLVPLPERFKDNMVVVGKLAATTGAVVTTATAIALVAGGAFAPVAAGAGLAVYVLLLAAVVGLGIDYTGAGGGLGWVVGVGALVSEIEGAR